MDTDKLKKHIQEEIAELNRLNGTDEQRYGLLDFDELKKDIEQARNHSLCSR